MSVLLVTAHMLTPIASVEPIHLDAVMMDRVARTRGYEPAHRGQSLPVLPPMPIVHLEMHGERVYLCSSWQCPDGAAMGRDYITKRRDGEDVDWLAQSFTPSAGPGKNYQLPVLTVEAATVAWLVVGNRQGVRHAVKDVSHLGAKRRMGYGAVQRWTVEHAERLPMDVLVDQGLAERFLPAAWCEAPPTVERGPVCPPYWHPARWTQRVRPGWRCELRSDVARAVEGVRC